MDDVCGIEPTTGTCMAMCPPGETQLREKEGLLHRFEMKSNQRRGRGRRLADPDRVVKEYSRPAAGRADPKPQELRPAPVLLRTVQYLINSIVGDHGDGDYAEVYDYVADRFRAVRQDMVVQSLSGSTAIQILEIIIRFHLYSAFRLSEADISMYDPYLNEQHTRECLKRLLSLYAISDSDAPNRVEFESAYLLLYISDTDALQHCLQLPPLVRKHPLLRQAYLISIHCMLGNVVRAIRLLKKFPSMLGMCAAHRHLAKLQCQQLQMMNVAFSVKSCRYPTSGLCALLCMEDLDGAMELCGLCGIMATAENVAFLKTDWKDPDKVPERRWHWLQQQLETVSLTDFLLGYVTPASSSSSSRGGISSATMTVPS